VISPNVPYILVAWESGSVPIRRDVIATPVALVSGKFIRIVVVSSQPVAEYFWMWPKAFTCGSWEEVGGGGWRW